MIANVKEIIINYNEKVLVKGMGMRELLES